MGPWRLLEACRVHEKVGLEHSSKSTKYELEGPYNDPVVRMFLFRGRTQTRLRPGGPGGKAQSLARFPLRCQKHARGPLGVVARGQGPG